MNIMGIHDGHNAAACLLVDGEIRMAIQEERLRRVKNWAGFPSQAIGFILNECQLSLENIDAFALAGSDMPDQNTKESRLALYRDVGQPGFVERQRQERMRRAIYDSVLPPGLRRALKHLAGIGTNGSSANGRLAQVLAFGIPETKIHVVEHHLAHAAAAYYGHGVYDRDVLVLTNDGEGDGFCASVSIGRAGTLRRVGSVPRSESIGNLYAVVTFLMGMVPLDTSIS